jgi:hypothetical protein
MRVLGIILGMAGILGAVASPLLGFPGSFAVLMPVAVVLWFVGIAATAVSLAPARPLRGIAAAVAAICGWFLLFVYGFAPLWGITAAACGVVVAVDRGPAMGARLTSLRRRDAPRDVPVGRSAPRTVDGRQDGVKNEKGSA